MSEPANKEAPTFEDSLEELERVVEKLEEGELSLDESLVQFQRGMELSKQCQQALDEAQLKVDVLLNPEDPESAQPFEHGD